ncbi:MAG: ABC transporter substrate binding protein [Lachnospiraceae bacterium]
MKNRFLRSVIGISAVMLMVSGCGSKEKETEPTSVEIAGVEVVGETETETESETETETESETASESESESETASELATELDLAVSDETEAETKAGISEEDVLVEPETKAGVQTEAPQTNTEKQTEKKETEKQTEKKENGKETEKQTEKKTPDKETEKQSEKQKETERKTPSKQRETEPKKRQETEKEGNGFLQASLETGNTSGNSGLMQQTEILTAAKETETAQETEAEIKSETKPTENTNPAAETEKMEAETKAEEPATEIETGQLPETEETTETLGKAEEETETESQESEAMISEEETNKNPLRTVNDVIIVRKEASVDSGRIAVLYPGEAVLQVSENGKWSEIRFAATDGLEDGYVKTEYLADAKKRYLAKEKVNVRKESDPDSEKLGAYLEKDPVLVEEQLSNGWSKVRYLEQEKAEVVDGYVRSEYLEKAEDSGNDLLTAEAAAIAGETEAQTTNETEAETMPETESETETETDGEEPETMAVTESETEAATEAVTEIVTESASEEETQTEIMSESETTTEAESETETEAITEARTDAETRSTVQATPQAQFDALKEAAPEAVCVGILYAKDNKTAKTELAEYETLASSLGYELQTVCVEETQDIDFAASDLVGEADAILCIPDSMIEELLDTVYAYAQEAGIPVIDVNGTVVGK